eukprot:TRINITY_DN2904_c0_g1_i2.p1 TRINITY_DN2904_c0_g1~~TRINITY_DN2904_c0_g1_i2.p1  ORF type:complete len:473 (+),score=49.19 TRINITY_DN2904_c0_g1_i2:98-1516(+)
MITYDAKRLFRILFRTHGSVLPMSFMYALPAASLAAGTKYVHLTYFPDYDFSSLSSISSTYTAVLGFLLVFRCQVAWGRFWDGASHLQVIKGGWINATSNIISFCSDKPDRQHEVQQFQHQLCRLMSMMYGSALIVVSDYTQGFDILSTEGLDPKLVNWAADQHDRLEIIMQWVQRLIVDKHRQKVIAIDPPILSRVFQELSNGMIQCGNAKRINRYPFPFPYAQMISLMLYLHLVATVVIGGLAMEHVAASVFYSLIATLAVWSINFIAMEIEAPFGTDDNDLPLPTLMQSFNDSLATLLQPNSRTPPDMAPITETQLLITSENWRKRLDRRLAEEDSKGSIMYNTGDCVEERGFPIVDVPPLAPAKPPQPSVDDAASAARAAAQQEIMDAMVQQLEKHNQAATRELRQLLESNREICRLLRSGAVSGQRSIPAPMSAIFTRADTDPLFCGSSLMHKALDPNLKSKAGVVG